MASATSYAVMIGFLSSVIRLSTPLLLASLGGYTSERSGTINIALEGLSLIGAFAAAAGAHAFHSPWMGILCGMSASIFFAAIHGYLCIQWGANQIISGIAINFLAVGLPPVVSKALYDFSGGTPQLTSLECMPHYFFGSPLVAATLFLIILMIFIHQNHKWGQYLRFAGEHPHALQSQGISVRRIRWQAIVLSGFFCGLAGSYLSIDHGTAFSRNMTAGRGYIALAALIVGRWTPQGASFACLMFGFIEASQILLQGLTLPSGNTVPVQWIQMIPYAATLLILAFYGTSTKRNSFAPKALGQPF